MFEPDRFRKVFRAETARGVPQDVLETHLQLVTHLTIL